MYLNLAVVPGFLDLLSEEEGGAAARCWHLVKVGVTLVPKGGRRRPRCWVLGFGGAGGLAHL